MAVLQKPVSARKWFGLLFAVVALAGGLACATGPQPMPADPPTATPLPSVTPTPPADPPAATPFPLVASTPPSPFSAEIDGLVPFTECVMDDMAGALQRPRNGLYANVPYLSDPTRSVGQEIDEEQELEHANRYLVPISELIVERCAHLIPPDVEANDETGAFTKEMGKAGVVDDQNGPSFRGHEAQLFRVASDQGH